MQNYWNLYLACKPKQLYVYVDYRDFRETSPLVRLRKKMSTSTLDNVTDSPNIDIHGIHKCFLLLLKKILDGREPDYLSEKLLSLKYHKSHNTTSRLPYRFSIPRTNSMKRMFVYNTVKLWNNVSENV